MLSLLTPSRDTYIYRRSLPTDQSRNNTHSFTVVLFDSIKPFYTVGVPVTIPLLSLYRRLYFYTFTIVKKSTINIGLSNAALIF